MRSLACLQAMCLRQWNVGMVKLCVAKIGWSVVKQWQVSLNFTQEYPHCSNMRWCLRGVSQFHQRHPKTASGIITNVWHARRPGLKGCLAQQHRSFSTLGLLSLELRSWFQDAAIYIHVPSRTHMLHDRTCSWKSFWVLDFWAARIKITTELAQTKLKSCKKNKAYLHDLQVSLPVLDYLFSLGAAVPLPVSLERKP